MSNDRKITEALLGKKIVSVSGDDFDYGIKLTLDDDTKLTIYPTEFLGAAMLGFRIKKIQEVIDMGAVGL